MIWKSLAGRIKKLNGPYQAPWALVCSLNKGYENLDLKRDNSPLCVIKQDEHAGTAVVLETLVVMSIGVPDQIIKYGSVYHVQEPRPRIVRRHFLHCFAVTLVVFPPE